MYDNIRGFFQESFTKVFIFRNLSLKPKSLNQSMSQNTKVSGTKELEKLILEYFSQQTKVCLQTCYTALITDIYLISYRVFFSSHAECSKCLFYKSHFTQTLLYFLQLKHFIHLTSMANLGSQINLACILYVWTVGGNRSGWREPTQEHRKTPTVVWPRNMPSVRQQC